MATLLQYRAAALIARLQAAGTGGNRLARTITRIGTPICPGDGPDAHHALRLKPDHPMGSGHKEAPNLRKLRHPKTTTMAKTKPHIMVAQDEESRLIESIPSWVLCTT